MDTHLRLADVIQDYLGEALRNFSVAIPGVVKSYDASSRTCSVQPAVAKLEPLEENEDFDAVEEWPVQQNVPVCWPAGRGFRFAGVSLSPGDSVLLIVCDRDIAGWRDSGDVSEPVDARLHDMAHCVALPCFEPKRTVPVLDAAALAGKIDILLRTVSSLTAPTSPAEAVAVVTGIIEAVRAVVGGSDGTPGTGTVASTVLELEA